MVDFPLHDHPRSKKMKKGPISEPVDPEDLADDAGDQTPLPTNPGEKLRKLGERKKAGDKKDD